MDCSYRASASCVSLRYPNDARRSARTTPLASMVSSISTAAPERARGSWAPASDGGLG